MIGCLLRGSEGVYKPRSQAGLGKGSHSTFQRVVGRLIQPVQPAYERMDFVQGGANQGVSGLRRLGLPIRASMCAHDPRSVTRPERDPLPPTPHHRRWGPLPNFPHFFTNRGLPLFQPERQLTKRSICNGIRDESWTGQPVQERQEDY